MSSIADTAAGASLPRITGSLKNCLFAALAVYGVSPLVAIRSGAWFSRH